MELTRKQEEGLRIAIERYKAGEKYTVISGYAGVGKSTLVRFIIEALDVESKQVCYTAFTGKAAEVLRKKGNDNAITLHKLLYNHVPTANGSFIRTPKDILEYDVIVVDEISMVPKSMIDLLFSHNCYVICLGDPFQLPPIDKDEDNHLLDNPHIFLDEIMRQAKESEIIRLTMDIRDEKPINIYDGKEVKIYQRKDFVSGMMTWADQVLVATNRTRTLYNNQIRQILGKGDFPEDGDKIVCLKNYWNDLSMDGDSLVNGTIGYLQLPKKKKIYVPRRFYTSTKEYEVLEANILLDGEDIFNKVNCDLKMIQEGVQTLDYKDVYKLGRAKKSIGDVIPREMTYGYALTCHKAQGSEWDRVLVSEESFPFQRNEHARWLYTASTRAAEKLILIKED